MGINKNKWRKNFLLLWWKCDRKWGKWYMG